MPDVDGLLSDWLDEEIAERPVLATRLGIAGHDDQLGDLSAAGFERRQAADRRWAERVGRLATDGLSADQALDIDLLRAELAGREVGVDWAEWRRDPDTYLAPCLSGVFLLFLNRLRPEAELVTDAAERLGQVPAVLEAARANLDATLANPLVVRRGLRQCQAGIAYARQLLPAEVADAGPRRRLAEAGEVAAQALEAFAAFLAELAVRATGPYAIGEARYSALLIQRELLGYGAGEMHDRGRAAYAELEAEATQLADRISPEASGWHEVVGRLSGDRPSSPAAMLADYRRSTAVARQFLVDHQLVTLPDGERCDVIPSPVFQRPVLAVASYSLPPPFSPSMTGHFFVPYPPEGTTEEEVNQRLEANNRHSIVTISVHEAYPGHHWHLSWSKLHSRPLRQVLRTSYFVEGWALYAERMMAEQGYFADPRDELCHLDARLFRAARIVVDTALHAGDMTVDQAIAFMTAKTGLTEPVARAEVGRYCSWPTQASSYLTGSLEIERIRARYLGDKRGDLRSFHDRIAASGSLPMALAERAVLGTGRPDVKPGGAQAQ